MEMVIKFKNWILEFVTVLSLSLMATSIFCNHPLMLCLTLILLATSTGFLSGLIFMKWIFYAIILIFLGGMMVVFIYITTLAGNEKFHMNILNPLVLFFLLAINLTHFYVPFLSQFKKEIFMSHLYFSNSASLLGFLIVFLLSALIIVIKLAENFKGALVKFS